MKEYKIKINGNDYAVTISSVEDNTAFVNVNGTEYEVEVEGMVSHQPKTPKIVQQSTTVSSTDTHPAVARTSSPASTASAAAGHIKAPLPGVIIEVFVKPGDTVKAGQKIMVLEAMKMENSIDSDRDGVVREINAQKGSTVLEGDTLITIG